jgi:hypothetical protein
VDPDLNALFFDTLHVGFLPIARKACLEYCCVATRTAAAVKVAAIATALCGDARLPRLYAKCCPSLRARHGRSAPRGGACGIRDRPLRCRPAAGMAGAQCAPPRLVHHPTEVIWLEPTHRVDLVLRFAARETNVREYAADTRHTAPCLTYR